MKPHVFTSTTAASSDSPATCQPPASRRAASSSESTSFRAQPRVTILTRRVTDGGLGWLEGTPADYGNDADASASAPPARPPRVAGAQRLAAGFPRAIQRDRVRLVGRYL